MKKFKNYKQYKNSEIDEIERKKNLFQKFPDERAAKGRTIHLLIRKLRLIIHTHKLISNTRKYAHFFCKRLKMIFY